MNASGSRTRELERLQFLFGIGTTDLFRLLKDQKFDIDRRHLRHLAQLACFSFLEPLFARRRAVGKLRRDPVIIIGHWRNGTTLLHRILSAAPGFRRWTFANSLFPRASENLGWVLPQIARKLPVTRGFDEQPLALDEAFEDEFALAKLGAVSPLLAAVFPLRASSFSPEMTAADARRAARLLANLLALQPGGEQRWLLKSPAHAFRVDALLERFPEACFINIVRGCESDVIASCRHMWSHLLEKNSLQDSAGFNITDWVRDCLTAHHRAIAKMRQTFPKSRFAELDLDELLNAPERVLCALFRQLRLGSWNEARQPVIEALKQAPGRRRTWTFENQHSPNPS